jgi:hypothetical protein
LNWKKEKNEKLITDNSNENVIELVIDNIPVENVIELVNDNIPVENNK